MLVRLTNEMKCLTESEHLHQRMSESLANRRVGTSNRSVRPNTYEIPRVFQAKPSGNFPYVRYYVLQSSFDKEGNLLRRLHLCIGKARGPLPDAIGWPFGLLTLTRAVGPRQQPFLLSTSTQEKPNLLRDPELDNEPLGQ